MSLLTQHLFLGLRASAKHRRIEKAREMFAETHPRFGEKFETADLKAAKELLGTLS